MLKIGLTGGIGSGKTAVSDTFKNLGAPIIDTDIIAHELIDNDPEVLQQITDTFGRDIFNSDGKLNRKKLAKIIFNDKENKQLLENILHPKIKDCVLSQLQDLVSRHSPPEYAVIVVPLLIEANYKNLFDRILVITADEQKRIERVQQRDNRSVSEIRSIITHQISDKKRLKEAKDIIENNSNIKNMESQVEQLDKKYTHLSTTNT